MSVLTRYSLDMNNTATFTATATSTTTAIIHRNNSTGQFAKATRLKNGNICITRDMYNKTIADSGAMTFAAAATQLFA